MSKALAIEFERVAAPVDPSATSTSKWKPAARVVADALGLDEDDVYGATISKAGNLSVRFEQSKTADADVLLAMWTGPSPIDFDRTVEAAKRHCSNRDAVLVAERVGTRSDGLPAWKVVVVITASGKVPSAIAAAWPNATALRF